jgi:hypothetical protein
MGNITKTGERNSDMTPAIRSRPFHELPAASSIPVAKHPKEHQLTASEKSKESRNTTILKLDWRTFDIYTVDV